MEVTVETKVLLGPAIQWTSIWYGFVADFMREQGFEELMWGTTSSTLADKKRFLERMEMLYSSIDLSYAYSRILSSTKPDPDDVQLIGLRLQEFEQVSPQAVQSLKTAIRDFLEKR